MLRKATNHVAWPSDEVTAKMCSLPWTLMRKCSREQVTRLYNDMAMLLSEEYVPIVMCVACNIAIRDCSTDFARGNPVGPHSKSARSDEKFGATYVLKIRPVRYREYSPLRSSSEYSSGFSSFGLLEICQSIPKKSQ